MFCTKCGNQIPDGARFCTSCGYDLTAKNECVNPAQPQVQFQETPAQPQAPQAIVQPPAEPQKKISKTKMLLGVLVVGVVVALVLAIGSFSQTSEMRTALKNNDPGAIYNTYQLAIGDEKLIGKYEDLISKKIAEITAEINSCDFSEDAKSQGSEVFEDYLYGAYGELLYGDYYDLEDSIYGTNNTEYLALEELIESKFAYYDGIYCLSNAEDLYDYQDAIESFSEVSDDDSNYEAALEKITESSQSYMDLTLKNVEEYIANDDISSAIELLNQAKEYFDLIGLDSTEIQSKIDSTLTTYAKKYADKAEAAFKEQDVNTAMGNIEVAIELQPENSDYIAQRDKYELYMPFELYREDNVLEFEENGDFWGTLYMDDTYTANDGSEMPHSINWYNNSDDASVSMSAIYNLQGKYDTVTGTIFLFEHDKSTDYTGYFVVYGDGAEIYTSPAVTGGVVPQDVSFDVSDIQTLEIAFFGQGSGGFLGSGPDFGVSNLIAQKAFPESE